MSWEKQEKRIAKAVGGKRRAGSGAFWSGKGDIRCDDLLIEAKWTGKQQLTLKAQVLKKIFTEAVIEGRMPVLAVELDKQNYCIVSEEDFFELRDELHRLRAEVRNVR